MVVRGHVSQRFFVLAPLPVTDESQLLILTGINSSLLYLINTRLVWMLAGPRGLVAHIYGMLSLRSPLLKLLLYRNLDHPSPNTARFHLHEICNLVLIVPVKLRSCIEISKLLSRVAHERARASES